MSEPEDHSVSAESTAAGLEDARATIAEIWRRTDDDEARKRCMRALRAVISAERTMQKADAFLQARTRRERSKTFDELRVSAIFRIGHDTRKVP